MFSGADLVFYNDRITLMGQGFYRPALSQLIKRMESEIQLEFAALVFQSHSEIMLNMIQLRFSNGVKLKILSESHIGRCCHLTFNDLMPSSFYLVIA